MSADCWARRPAVAVGALLCTSCGLEYYCMESMDIADAVVGTAIPHRLCQYGPSGTLYVVMAPTWCSDMRSILSIYNIPGRDWPGYFEAVRAGTLPLDDLKLMLDLAGDGE